MAKVINWPDFVFPPVNLLCYAKQYRDYQEYRRQCVLSNKHKEPDVLTNHKIIELLKDR
jgi:hypothetical protein